MNWTARGFALLIAVSVFGNPAESEAGLLDWLFPWRQTPATGYYPAQPIVLPGQAGQTTAYYGGGQFAGGTPYAGGAVVASGLPTVTYRPSVSYQTVYRQVPVTVYRPVTRYTLARIPMIQMQPCTTYTVQAQRVPYASYQPQISYQPAAGCGTCPSGCSASQSVGLPYSAGGCSTCPATATAGGTYYQPGPAAGTTPADVPPTLNSTQTQRPLLNQPEPPAATPWQKVPSSSDRPTSGSASPSSSRQPASTPSAEIAPNTASAEGPGGRAHFPRPATSANPPRAELRLQPVPDLDWLEQRRASFRRETNEKLPENTAAVRRSWIQAAWEHRPGTLRLATHATESTGPSKASLAPPPLPEAPTEPRIDDSGWSAYRP